MRRTISFTLGSFLVASCGIAEHVEDEWDAVAEPRLIMQRTDETTTEALLCSTDRDPVSLGVVQNVLVSSDGHFAAIQRAEGASILSLATSRERRLPGERVSLDGAQWSPQENRLAYLADGVPRLASADSLWSKALDLDLPAPTDDYEYEAAEWSADGQQVAFATRRWGVLTDREGATSSVFSEKVVGPYGTPWALSFSADGKTLAVLQTEEPEGPRTLLLLDIPSMTARAVEGISHYSLFGWASDDSGVTLMDTNIKIWFVPRDGSEPKDGGSPSPTAPELAMINAAGLPVQSLHDGSVRMLLPDSMIVQSVRWEAGGQVIWYGDNADTGFLRASDGTLLARGSGVVRDDGWAALVDPEAPEFLVTRDLFAAPESGARFRWGVLEGGRFISDLVQWLEEDRLAFLGADGLHVARPDGSDDRTICPPGSMLFKRQSRTRRVW